MRQATLVWALRQAPLQPSARAFTRPGYRRSAEWVTALAPDVEEHTVTRPVTATDRVADWKALEAFAGHGSWQADYLASSLTRPVGKAPGRVWHGYHASAVDDTKAHRSGGHVWGACTSHGSTARRPNRAATVGAHNRVVPGALLENPGRPAWSSPISGRLYFRKSRLPLRPGCRSLTEPFRAKCESAVELLREQARTAKGLHPGAFDGGFAPRSVVRPPVSPEGRSPRVEFLTRPRHDARLHALPPAVRRQGRRGPMPKWGRRLPPPRQGGRWTRWWQKGDAFLYGRRREVLWKEVVCLWRVSGHQVPAKAVVAKAEGYKKRFTLVSSASALTGSDRGGGRSGRRSGGRWRVLDRQPW